VTLKTVEFHLRQIYRKLGARSRAQLVATLAGNPALSAGDPALSAPASDEPRASAPPVGEPPRLSAKG